MNLGKMREVRDLRDNVRKSLVILERFVEGFLSKALLTASRDARLLFIYLITG